MDDLMNVFLVTYYDSYKEDNQNIIVMIKKDKENLENISEEIFKYQYPHETYKGEIKFITAEKLYEAKRNDIEIYNFLEIR